MIVLNMSRNMKQLAGLESVAVVEAGLSLAAVGFTITAMTIVLTVSPGALLRELFGRMGLYLVRTIMLMATMLTFIGAVLAYSLFGLFDATWTANIVVGSTIWGTFCQIRLLGVFAQVFALVIAERAS